MRMRPITDHPALYALAVVAVAVLLIWLGGCASDKPGTPQTDSSAASNVEAAPPKTVENPPERKPETPSPEDTGPTLGLVQKRASVRWTDPNGHRQMTATAREIGWNEESSKGKALDFSGKLYENGKLTAEIKAPKAIIDTKTQTVTATGGVVMKSLERQTVVHSEWVRWYARKQEIVGNGGVKIDSPDWKAEGAAFRADTSLRNYTILDSAKGLEL